MNKEAVALAVRRLEAEVLLRLRVKTKKLTKARVKGVLKAVEAAVLELRKRHQDTVRLQFDQKADSHG